MVAPVWQRLTIVEDDLDSENDPKNEADLENEAEPKNEEDLENEYNRTVEDDLKNTNDKFRTKMTQNIRTISEFKTSPQIILLIPPKIRHSWLWCW